MYYEWKVHPFCSNRDVLMQSGEQQSPITLKQKISFLFIIHTTFFMQTMHYTKKKYESMAKNYMRNPVCHNAKILQK